MRRRFTLNKHLAVMTIFLSVCSSVWPQTANHEVADNSLASILPDTVITNRPDGREVIYSESSHNIWQSNGTLGEDNIDHKMKQIVFGNDGMCTSATLSSTSMVSRVGLKARLTATPSVFHCRRNTIRWAAATVNATLL